jgi:hypothetical protein
MAIETINIGTSPNDGTGDPLRVAFDKINDNFLNVTTDGGDEITVLNPTTATDTTLNTALADLASGGSTPTLQEVTDEGNETTNAIKVANLGLFDPAEEDYGKAELNGNLFNFELVGGLSVLNVDGNGVLSVKSPLETTFQYNVEQSDLTDNRNFKVPNQSGFFKVEEIKTSNFTSVINGGYTANGTLTVTDPTPVTNKGFTVHVIGGSVTIGGVAYASGALVYRYYDGSVWISTNMNNAITIDATPTDGSSNAVSSNGVFDALALKQDKSKSETFVLSKANGTFGSHTGTTAETVLFSADISAGEFTAGDFMKVMLDITKVGTAGTASVRLRAGTTGTTSDALIGTLFLLSGTLDAGFIRERFQFLSGNLLSGIQNNYTANQTDIVINSVVKQSTSLTPSNAWKITVSVALANSADTVSCLGYRVSKIKTI